VVGSEIKLNSNDITAHRALPLFFSPHVEFLQYVVGLEGLAYCRGARVSKAIIRDIQDFQEDICLECKEQSQGSTSDVAESQGTRASEPRRPEQGQSLEGQRSQGRVIKVLHRPPPVILRPNSDQ
jgi:hypothetical protein